MDRKRFSLEQVVIKLHKKEHIMQKWEYAELSWEVIDSFEVQLTLYHYDSNENGGAHKYVIGDRQGSFKPANTDPATRKQLSELGRNGWETYQVAYQDTSYPKWFLKRSLAD
jgi:hypothetical protein